MFDSLFKFLIFIFKINFKCCTDMKIFLLIAGCLLMASALSAVDFEQLHLETFSHLAMEGYSDELEETPPLVIHVETISTEQEALPIVTDEDDEKKEEPEEIP